MSAMPLPGEGQPDDTRGPQILGAVISTTLVALIVFCLRIYVRIHMVRNVGIDDYIMLVAILLSLAGTGIIIAQVQYGAGRHIAYLDPETNRIGLKLNFITQPIYLWAIPMAKLSIGFFLMRIGPSLVYRRIVQGVMAFLMVYTSACFITLMIQCSDLSVLWDTRVESKCWPPETLRALSYSNTTVNVTTDLFFALIPIPMLWHIQTNTRTKVSLLCVLGVGVFACAAGIVKAVAISNYAKHGDFLWDSADLTIWNTAELNTGIVAACTPCIKPMFKKVFDSALRYASPQKSKSYNLRSYSHVSSRSNGYRRSMWVQPQTGMDATGSRNGRHGNSMGDDISLESLSTQPLNGIVKTTVVTVDSTSCEPGEVSGSQKNHPEEWMDKTP
ncbi:hypothetical protein F4804DRAFT_351522 [Jackrogersella minutella]|nr:hypothetical protein F4804DRAFT_351522 [Jackrogersella minutella]